MNKLLKRNIALITGGLFLFNSLFWYVSAVDTQTQITTFDNQSGQANSEVETQKAVQLGIFKDVSEKTATFAEGIIWALRTAMLLDYRVGLIPSTEAITWNPSIDGYLETAKIIYGVQVTKDNVWTPLTKDLLVSEINKIVQVPADNITKSVLTKKDLAVLFVKAYEGETQKQLTDLEWKTNDSENVDTNSDNQNTETDGTSVNSDDILGDALNDLFNSTDDTTTDQTIDETTEWQTQITSESVEISVVNPWEINIKTTSDISKVVVKNEDKELSVELEKVDNGYKVILPTVLVDGDVLTITGYNQENQVFTKQITVKLDKEIYVDQLNDSIVVGYSTIAKLVLTKDTTVKIEVSGLFNDDDLGNLYITDDKYDIKFEKKIRASNEYDRDLQAGTYFLVLENKKSGNWTVNIKINWQSLKAKTYDLTLGDVNMTFSADSTATRDVNSNDKINLVWTVQNTGDEKVVLTKFKLKTDWTADVKTLEIWTWENGSCSINKDYTVTEDRWDFLFVNNNINSAINLNVTETKSICIVATDFIGEENDYVKFSLDDDDLSVLWSVAKYPGLFAKTSVWDILDWYGKYTLRSTSILYSQASDILVKVPVGSNVPLFKWDVDILGQPVRTDEITIYVDNLTRDFNENELDNIKLVYQLDNGAEQVIDIDTSPVLNGNRYVLTFKNDVEIPVGKGKFKLYADLANSLDGNNLKVSVLKTMSKFKNQDDDDVYPVSDVISPDLLVLKSDLDISSTIKTRNVLVNTTDILGEWTINNLGGTPVTISKVNLEQNTANWYVTGKFSIAAIGYVDWVQKDDINPSDVKLITNYENILDKNSYSFAITSPVTIEPGKSATFVVLGKINDEGVNDGDMMEWTIPVNGITLVTSYGSTVTNDNSLSLDILKARLSGKATITMHDDVDDAKIKSPADKYVSLGRFTVDAQYEWIRLNKIKLVGIKNDTETGFLDLDKIYIVRSDDTSCKTDDIDFDNVKGVGIVSTNNDSVVVSMNETVDRTDEGADNLPNYCIYGKLLTNESGFTKGNLKVKFGTASDFEVYGVNTGNLYNTTSLSVSGEGRLVNFYPAVLTFNTKSVVPNTTVGPNKTLLEFTLTNNDDENIKVKELKFKLTAAPEFVIRNFKLVDSVTDDTIATLYLYKTTSDGTPIIDFNNLDYMLNKYYSKDLKLVADVWTRTNDVSATASITVNYGNPNDSDTRKDSSIRYVAVDDENNEVSYSNTIHDVWFVKTDDTNVSGNESTYTIIDTDGTGLIATCNSLIDESKTTATFHYDEDNDKFVWTFVLGMNSSNTNEMTQTVADNLWFSMPDYLQLFNISDPTIDSNGNIVVNFDYTLDDTTKPVLWTDIPLFSADNILIHTYINDCYDTTNNNPSSPDYYIDRNNSTEDILLETNSDKNNLQVSTMNNATEGDGKIETNDRIKVTVSDIDNQSNALYNLIGGDINDTDVSVTLLTGADVGVTGDTVKDVININDKVAFRFVGLSSDLVQTDGGDSNAQTADLLFGSSNNYNIDVLFKGDDTISDVSAATAIEVYVKNSDGDWISIGQASYNNTF